MLVSVALGAKWKGSVCGLCGDFNNNAQDDFISTYGIEYSDPIMFGKNLTATL